MVKKRRRHSAAYKIRITLEALEGSKTISQLSSEYEIHPNMIRAWKRQLLEDGPSASASTTLHAKFLPLLVGNSLCRHPNYCRQCDRNNQTSTKPNTCLTCTIDIFAKR